MEKEEEHSEEAASQLFREATGLIEELVPGPESSDPYLSGEVFRPPSEDRIQESFALLKDMISQMDGERRGRFYAWLDAYCGQHGGRLVSLLTEFRDEVEISGEAEESESDPESDGLVSSRATEDRRP